jgi:uncharacterized protein YutD
MCFVYVRCWCSVQKDKQFCDMQAKYSVIDFDFLGYSQLRWKQYYTAREDVLKVVPEKPAES